MQHFLHTTLTIFTSQVLLSLRSVRFLLSFLLAAAPVVLAAFISIAIPASEDVPVPVICWMLIAQAITPLLALMFGSAVISEEVSDRTITYLFTRPVSRVSVLLGRWLANLAIVSSLLAMSSFGLIFVLSDYLGGAAYFESAWALTQTVILGAATYSALFAALGVLIKHPIIVGLAYVFCFEFLLVNAPIPGSSQHISLQFHLRSFIANSGAEIWKDVIIFSSNDLIARGDAFLVHAVVLAIALIGGSLLVRRRQFELTA